MTPIPDTFPSFEFDAFISYRHQQPDQAWVRDKLVPALEAEDLKICVDFRNFRLGRSIIKEMERGVESSKFTVAVLSPAWLASNFTELESLLSEHLGLEQSQRRFICILYQPCQPRLGIRANIWLDMTDEQKFTDGLTVLVQELRSAPEK
jgi:hypothetical protein